MEGAMPTSSLAQYPSNVVTLEFVCAELPSMWAPPPGTAQEADTDAIAHQERVRNDIANPLTVQGVVRRSLFAETEKREGVEGTTAGIVAPLGGTTLRMLRQRPGFIGKFRTKKRPERCLALN